MNYALAMPNTFYEFEMRYHKRYFSSKSKASSLCLSLVRNPNPFAVPCVVFPGPGALGLQVP